MERLRGQDRGASSEPSLAPVAPSAVVPSAAPPFSTPRLVAETQSIGFPKTGVGRSSTRWIAIRNDGDRAVALDDVVAMHADPFHEIRSGLNASVWLQPGERCEIPIVFRPARAAKVEQSLQLVTALGTCGLDGQIRVFGEGIDVPYEGGASEFPDDAVSSEWATEIRIEDQGRDGVAAAKPHDELAVTRARAHDRVTRWRQAATQYTHSLAEWTLANWLDFLGKTGGDHVLRGSTEVMGVWRRLVVKDKPKSSLKSARRGLVSAAKNAALFAATIEYLPARLAVNKAIDTLAEFILDKVGGLATPQEDSDAHALEATRNVAAAGVQKTHEIMSYEARANLSVEDTASGADQRIAHAETAEELEQWQDWAERERADLSTLVKPQGHELSDELLKLWVLEHAGTTKTANASTNPKAWQAARDELQKKGVLPTVARNDLFIHQCRAEWGWLGLTETDQVLAGIEAKRAVAESNSRALGNAGEGLAAQVANGVGDPSSSTGAMPNSKNVPPQFLVTFTHTSNPAQLATVLGKHVRALDPEGNGPSAARSFGKPFTLDCRVFLEVDGKGVIVQNFLYSVRTADGRGYRDIFRSPGAP